MERLEGMREISRGWNDRAGSVLGGTVSRIRRRNDPQLPRLSALTVAAAGNPKGEQVSRDR